MSAVTTHPSPVIDSPEEVARKARTSNLLTPRFYTTDFAAMDRIDVAPIRAEWDAMMAEYEGDNNHDHFQRTPEFAAEAQAQMEQWTPELRQEFPDQFSDQRVQRLHSLQRDPEKRHQP
jgi:magnesium-protoporphyrin IX monomethyl ester (oxidative) cyclase